MKTLDLLLEELRGTQDVSALTGIMSEIRRRLPGCDVWLSDFGLRRRVKFGLLDETTGVNADNLTADALIERLRGLASGRQVPATGRQTPAPVGESSSAKLVAAQLEEAALQTDRIRRREEEIRLLQQREMARAFFVP